MSEEESAPAPKPRNKGHRPGYVSPRKMGMAPLPPPGMFTTPDGKDWVPTETQRKVARVVVEKGYTRAAAIRKIDPVKYMKQPDDLKDPAHIYSNNLSRSPHYGNYEDWYRRQFISHANAKGVTLPRLAAKLDELLDAKKEHVVRLRMEGEDGKQREGVVKVEVRDNETQKDALKLALDIHGITNSSRSGGVNVNVDTRRQSVNITNNGASATAFPDLILTTLGPIHPDHLGAVMKAVSSADLIAWTRERQEAARLSKTPPLLPLAALPPGVTLFSLKPSPSEMPQIEAGAEEEAIEGEYEEETEEDDSFPFGDHADD